MSWTDNGSIQQILKLKELYNIKTFVETGTFRGVNSEVHALNFDNVLTCELVPEYYEISKKRLGKYKNVSMLLEKSDTFLEKIKNIYLTSKNIIFIYLDAHFYDPKLSPEDRWVVLKELKVLNNFNKCVIAIHDFCNGELGHLTYDGQPLNFELLKQDLYNVNPNFNYYTNTYDGCDIVTLETMKKHYNHVEIDDNMKDTLEFVWSSEQKAYRGILYCTPTELNLQDFNLRKLT